MTKEDIKWLEAYAGVIAVIDPAGPNGAAAKIRQAAAAIKAQQDEIERLREQLDAQDEILDDLMLSP